MNISEDRKRALEETYQYYFHNEKILKMKEIPAHRGSNTFIHTFKLVKAVMRKAIKSRKEIDLESLLLATILHDYYLYDWRTNKNYVKPHGKTHPYVAIGNAKRDFGISDKVAKIMESHMWPLNFKKYPKGKEARIICYTDKDIAMIECLTSKKYKKRKEKYYLEKLSTLF